MSLTTRKEASSNGSTSQKAFHAATHTAAQVVPMAKNAGQAARHGAEAARNWAEPQLSAARSWAEPQVRAARSWAAPRVEQAGVVVRDRIGPTVSGALVEASHRLDGVAEQQRQRRRWPRLVAAVAMIAAAASAVAAIVLKRQAEVILTSEDQPADGGATAANVSDGAAPATEEPGTGQTPGAAGETGPDSDDRSP